MEINIRIKRAENGFVVYIESDCGNGITPIDERIVIAATPEQVVDAVVPRVTEIVRNDLGAVGA